MPTQYTVKQGDCISSIAYAHGFFPDTIWNHSDNSQLKQKRKNPNLLLPGDIVVIPDKELKEVSKPTEQEHKFRKKGVPAEFRLRVLDEAAPASSGASQPADKPRANVPFRFYIDDTLHKEGQTDGDGYVKCSIPPNAAQGRLVLEPGTDKETALLLNFGHLDPIEEVSGVQARLRNLGFDCGDEDGEIGPQTKEALKSFQSKNGLDATGELNDSTRDKLRQAHDGA